MKFLSLFLNLGFLLQLTLALLAVPAKPSNDDFYDAPENLASFKEGDVMKWRQTPQKVRALLYPVSVEGAWQFMVRSTNSQGEPVGIVGTIIKPYNADPSKLLTFNYFQDSVSVDCVPSYSILYGADVGTIATQLESTYMKAAISQGWYILVPDYEGPNAAFAAGKLAGMATLDAIRATLSSGESTGISSDAQVAIWGYSGGSIPAGWAGALQPSYAPELSKNLIGIAVGGWVTDLTLVVEKIDGTPYAAFVGAGMLGLSSEYPEVQSQIFERMDPLKIEKVKTLYNQCLIESITNFVGVNFFKGNSPVFPEKWNVFQVPEVKQMMEENILAFNLSSPMPKVPFFVYHGKPDQIIPFENSQRVYDTWCAQGMGSMEFAVSLGSGHLNEWLEGGGAALAWITRRFDGKAPVTGCYRTERKSNLNYPGSALGFSTVFRSTIPLVFQNQLSPLLNKTTSKLTLRIIYNIMAFLIKSMRFFQFKRDEIITDDMSQMIDL